MAPWLEAIVIILGIVLVARAIKRSSKLLQRFFIPSSLVAGFAALLLGPQLIGWIPDTITNQWQAYPSFLINIVFAGLFLGHAIPSAREVWQKSAPMLAFGNVLAWGQYVLGIGLTLLILGPLFNAPPMTGALMEIGFEGGHGTAAGLSQTFSDLGWPAATDIALGLATVSIVAAIASGIIIINLHQRRAGRVFDEVAMKKQQQRMIRNGYSLTKFANKLETNPKELVFTVLLFAMSIWLGWIMLKMLVSFEDVLLAGRTDLRIFKHLPLFPMAMLGGLIVQRVLDALSLSRLVKRNTVKVFSAIALDLLIISAIATLSLSAIKDNLAIFLILAVTGIVWILSAFFVLAPRFFKRNWFENGITNTGQSMGMTATGLLMNRLADPSNRTHAREAFAYKQLAFEPFMGGGVVTAVAAVFLTEFGQIPVFVVVFVVFLFWLILGLRLGSGGKRRRISKIETTLGRLASLGRKGN